MAGAVLNKLADEAESCIVGNMGCRLLLTGFTVEKLWLSATFRNSVPVTTHMRKATLDDSGCYSSTNGEGIENHLDLLLVNTMYTKLT